MTQAISARLAKLEAKAPTNAVRNFIVSGGNAEGVDGFLRSFGVHPVATDVIEHNAEVDEDGRPIEAFTLVSSSDMSVMMAYVAKYGRRLGAFS